MINAYGKYKDARNASWQILINNKINKLPVSVVNIATNANISIIKNSEVKELRTGEVGVSILDNEIWYIIYNDAAPIGRIRFTIAHELGHIFLGHPLNAGYHARSINLKKPETEIQADIFASRLLAPACVLWGLNLHTADEIMAACNISHSAAQIRAERMAILYSRNVFLQSDLEKKVYSNFSEFINISKKGK